MFVTSAMAQDTTTPAAPAMGATDLLIQFAPILLLVVIFWLLIFGLAVFAGRHAPVLQLVRNLWPLTAYLIWSAATVLWALSPEIVVRRLLLQVFVVGAVVLPIALIDDVDKVRATVLRVMFAVMIINVAALVIRPPTPLEPAWSNWREACSFGRTWRSSMLSSIGSTLIPTTPWIRSIATPPGERCGIAFGARQRLLRCERSRNRAASCRAGFRPGRPQRAIERSRAKRCPRSGDDGPDDRDRSPDRAH